MTRQTGKTPGTPAGPVIARGRRWLRHRCREGAALGRSQAGNIVVELALLAPVFVALLVGTIEIVSFLHLRQKLEVAASGLGDLVTMETRLSESAISDMLATAARAAAPLDLERGRILVTSLHNPHGGGPDIAWRRSSGSMEAESSINPDAKGRSLPGGMKLREGDNVIIVELIARYEPIFGSHFLAPTTLRAQSLFLPRRGSLTSVADD